MCPVETAIVLGSLALVTSITSGIVGAVGASRQAQAQADFQARQARARNEQISENNRLAEESARRQSAEANLRLQQQDKADSRNIQHQDKLRRQAQATARVTAGEQGASGVSLENILADFERQDAVFDDTIRENREIAGLRTKTQLEAIKAQAEGRRNAIQPIVQAPIQGPSFIGSALSIGGNALGQAASFAMPFGVAAYKG